MKKDFWDWHRQKTDLNNSGSIAFFYEREVWWCFLGINIGFEQDGNLERFARPVIIITKFNLDSCLIVPLTTKTKRGKYYFDLGEVGGFRSTAILSQLRFIDQKRLTSKVGILEQSLFRDLVMSIVTTCFSGSLK
jgi:mRNA interferase MazF